jgi:prophage regulatory protein
MPLDMLDRLTLDPGTRTLGELMQEREWAVWEIRLLRLAEVSTMVGLKRSSIYRYVAEGRFPAPIKVGIRGVRWKLADVLAWAPLSHGRDNGL